MWTTRKGFSRRPCAKTSRRASDGLLSDVVLTQHRQGGLMSCQPRTACRNPRCAIPATGNYGCALHGFLRSVPCALEAAGDPALAMCPPV